MQSKKKSNKKEIKVNDFCYTKEELQKAELYMYGQAIQRINKVEKTYFMKRFSPETLLEFHEEFNQMLYNWFEVANKKIKQFFPVPNIVVTGNYTYLFSKRTEAMTIVEFLQQRDSSNTMSLIKNSILYSIRSFLVKLLKAIEMLNDKKLAHRKLDISKVLVLIKGTKMSVFFTGIKYLKQFGAKYFEKEEWLNLPEEMEREVTISEATNILSFGLFLKKFRLLLKSGDDVSKNFFKSLETIADQCLEVDLTKRISLKNLLDEIKFLETGISDFEVDYSTVEGFKNDLYKKFLIVKYNKLKKSSDCFSAFKCRIDKNEIDKTVEALHALESYTEKNMKMNSSLALRLKTFYKKNEEICIIEYLLPEGCIQLRKYLEKLDNEKIEDKKKGDELMKVFWKITFALRQTKLRPLYYNINLDTVYIDNKSGNLEVYLFQSDPKEHNPYFSPKSEQESDTRQFGKLVLTTVFGDESKSKAEPLNRKNWFDDINSIDTLCKQAMNGKWNLGDIRNCGFFSNLVPEILNKNKHKEYVKIYTDLNKKSIGKGRFGEVYKCKKRSKDGKIFAMKVTELLKTGLDDDSDSEVKKMNECSSCDYIVELKENYVYKNNNYIIMEYFPIDLSTCLCSGCDERFLFTNLDIKRIAFNIAEAINFMHQRKFVHTDIKPANVLIRFNDSYEEVKENYKANKIRNTKDIVALAKLADLGKSGGTGLYLISDDNTSAQSTKSDVWAYGLTLFQLAMRDIHAVPSNSKKSYYTKIDNFVKNKELSSELGEVIKKALNHEKPITIENLLKEKYFEEFRK